MPIHNYICEAGHVEMDVYFTRARGGAETARACPDCGKASSIHFGSFGAYNRLMTTKGHNQSEPSRGRYMGRPQSRGRIESRATSGAADPVGRQ